MDNGGKGQGGFLSDTVHQVLCVSGVNMPDGDQGAEPANAVTDDDEYVIETSYAFQVAKNLELLTDVQLLLDPANDPSNDSVWIASLRVLITL